MPEIIEGRRRGYGGGTRGILADGGDFYRRREDENKNNWPEQAEAPDKAPAQQQQQQQQHIPSQSTTALHAKSSPEDQQATIEAARKMFQNRKPRKKRRTSLLSPAGQLEDESFSFGAKRRSKQKSKQLRQRVANTSNHHAGRTNYPMVTPAASIASIVDHDLPTNVVTRTAQVTSAMGASNHDNAKHEATARESPLSWQSPLPNSPSQNDTNKQELEALKESYRLQLEELTRKHKKEIEELVVKHTSVVQTTIDEIQENHATADKAKEEKHTKALEEAISNLKGEQSLADKATEEQHSNALKGAIASLEEKLTLADKVKEEEKAIAVKEAVKQECSRVTTLWEEDKQSQQQQLTLLQQELESCKAQLENRIELGKLRGMADQQLQVQKFTTNMIKLSRGQREGNVENQRQQVRLKEAQDILEAEKNESEKQRKPSRSSVLEESSTYFSIDSDAATPPAIHRFPLVERFAISPRDHRDLATASGATRHAAHSFRSSCKTFELAIAQEAIKKQRILTPDAVSTAALLMGLSDEGKEEPEPKDIDSMKSDAKQAAKSVLDKSDSPEKVPASKAPTRKSPRVKAKTLRTSPRKRLQDVIPKFNFPSGFGHATKRLKTKR